MEYWELQQRMSLPLEAKVHLTESRIRDFYDKCEGNIYVAFSGGKDSTVLLHIVRNIFPSIKAVYYDTGLEFPEIKDFVKTIDNVDIIRPKLSFKQVIDKYGYPVISKEQSRRIHDYRTTKSEKYKQICYKEISAKWKYMIDAPFKISDRCCYVMKKYPAYKYENNTKLHPIIGTMASESQRRLVSYLQYGCNNFDSERPTSKPLSFWTEKDIWGYIKLNNIQYSKIYDMGYYRTGCMWCMFGVDQERGGNRFQKMSRTHPQIHEYCMTQLGLKEVLDYMKIKTHYLVS